LPTRLDPGPIRYNAFVRQLLSTEKDLTMLHLSDLGEFAHRFHLHADKNGHVPEHGDHWKQMDYNHGANDPDEEGISDEERQRRTSYLDEQWWPNILSQVNQEKDTLSQLPGGNPIRKWRETAMNEPQQAHGFEVEREEGEA
jgi:hypothetical protein